ncbi:MAG: biopolymer transporter ExbD [Calothrix sp. MO_192.B10]|nr:biopolymer transporter ExbD [Calothrix sp. MO_192.B10]
MRLPDEPDLPPQLNIVPMIDVIFAILAFFIISTMFLTKQEGLPVNLPNAITAKPQLSSESITVTVDSKGKISLNRKPVTLDALQIEVQKLIAPQEQVLVMVQADKQVNHGQVVAVMDRLRQVRGAQLAIAAEKSP